MRLTDCLEYEHRQKKTLYLCPAGKNRNIQIQHSSVKVIQCIPNFFSYLCLNKSKAQIEHWSTSRSKNWNVRIPTVIMEEAVDEQAFVGIIYLINDGHLIQFCFVVFPRWNVALELNQNETAVHLSTCALPIPTAVLDLWGDELKNIILSASSAIADGGHHHVLFSRCCGSGNMPLSLCRPLPFPNVLQDNLTQIMPHTGVLEQSKWPNLVTCDLFPQG